MTHVGQESSQFRQGLGLTWKLVIHSLWVLVLLATTLTWFSLRQERGLLLDELRMRHTAQTNFWIQNNLVNLISPEPAAMEGLAKDLQTSSDAAYVVMYDAQGKVLAKTGPESAHVMPRALNPQQLSDHDAPFETMVGGSGRFYDLALPITLPQGSASPISSLSELMPSPPPQPSRPDVLGIVRMGISAESVNAKMAVVRNTSVSLAAAIVIVTLLLSYVFMSRATRPIKEVAQQATAIANGDFERTSDLLRVRSHDEVGELAKNFHSMAVRLKDSREELQRFNRQLEQRVIERTAELQTMNQQLGEANRRLMELDQLKSNFLSTVSHELRTPLTSIKAFAEILLDNQGEDPDTQLHFLEIINSESERLSRLINDLLDLAKIESGTVNWKMERLDVCQVIQKSLDGVSSLAVKSGLTLCFNKPAEMPGITGDRDKLVQVVTNLLSNAIKFTNEGGRVDIDAERIRGGDKDFIQISIRDSGIGIPQEHLARIFEKFHQVDNASTRKRGGGTGLGLAIVREIVEHHGGSVSVESELSRGSTFSIILPIAVEAVPAESERARPIPVTGGESRNGASRKKVLVVDDEPHIRELLKYELTGEGYEVLEAGSGEETVAIARSERPSIITLDVLMPGIDGFDVLSILSHDPETSAIPVILVSVLDDRDKGFRLGAVDYLTKPIDRKDFLDCIRRVSTQLDGSSGRKVLVVDDDAAITEALQKILSAEGFEVATAPDGETAIEQVTAFNPDLIVLDLKLPGISGYDVMRQLKSAEHSKSTPIVVMTASDLGRGRAKSLAMGASEYLTKPFSKAEFLETLKGLLAGAKHDA
jgi:signal transduction histidine kinase/DNA-binding response OmpR family regulator